MSIETRLATEGDLVVIARVHSDAWCSTFLDRLRAAFRHINRVGNTFVLPGSPLDTAKRPLPCASSQ